MTRRLLLTLALALALTVSALAADDLAEAQRLVEAGRPAEALPILTRLAADPKASDEVFLALGSAYYQLSVVTADEAQATTYRKKGREALLKARELGSEDPLLDSMLEVMPADGSDPRVFSKIAGADLAMRRGEQAFANHDMAGARLQYEEALKLDPALYYAPLFLGDTFLDDKNYAEAMKWYARAVAIDPSLETAYRYWGNVFLRNGQPAEARQKYLLAIVREPYSRLVWKNGLAYWAEFTGHELSMPQVEPGVKVSGSEIQVLGEPNPAWLAYGMERVLWRKEKFAKRFPGKAYRHSLPEETEALAAAADLAADTKDPGLALLVELKRKGLLEAFVLFSRVDPEISEDYGAYAAAHEPQLLEFLGDYVAPATP